MIWLIAVLIGLWILACNRVNGWAGLALIAGALAICSASGEAAAFSGFVWTLFIIAVVLLKVRWLRCRLISSPVLKIMRKTMPAVSRTEREALEAGNVWWDAELFSGNPDWSRLQHLSPPALSEDERAFLNGPVEELCKMLDDWDITHNRADLPPEVWDFIKKNKFFSMIIPKRYGGLEFSVYAHSEVVMKVASRSITAGVTIMVPNSLGPGKLLLEYGTEAQKDYYLPRLASGIEVPCFALTGPEAGSDAGSLPDEGIVCRSEFQGQKDVLGICLNWDKRYITLGPVATVIGMAFKLYDPDSLIGDTKDIGITVALIPRDTPGVLIGNRHFPLNSAFQNGPNRGKDVFIPMDWVIGGQEQVGNGWRMLVECLAEGRGVSLPALSTGAGKTASRFTGAYARVRKQFNVPIGHFEGIEEPLARIAGEAYLMDAARKITAAALDQGEKPSVISAIMKYELTERMRQVVNDAMDIHAGSGICLGPKNYIGRIYEVVPVSITVEGANILTRSLIIFGQGAVRCHPFIQKEMTAIAMEDPKQAAKLFDDALFKHIGFIFGNIARATWLALSNAHFANVPGDRNTRSYYRQIARLSAGFALIADFALITLGGALKRKERLSGRFADVLSNLYLCSAVLKHYQDQGSEEEDLPLLNWACRNTIHRAQQSLLAVFWNLPNRSLAVLVRSLIFPTGKPYAPPDDAVIHAAAAILLKNSETRDRLTQGIYLNSRANDPTGRIEHAFRAVLDAEPVEKKITEARRSGKLVVQCPSELIGKALEAGIIDSVEADLARTAEQATRDAISVDEFSPEFLTAGG
ncbi:MAG: acyl-CoA dehydrogenase [Methylococcales bacterium]